MRPTPKSPLHQHLITDFILRNEVQVLPPGSAIRDNDGEDWKTINRNNYLIKMDKESAQ